MNCPWSRMFWKALWCHDWMSRHLNFKTWEQCSIPYKNCLGILICSIRNLIRWQNKWFINAFWIFAHITKHLWKKVKLEVIPIKVCTVRLELNFSNKNIGYCSEFQIWQVIKAVSCSEIECWSDHRCQHKDTVSHLNEFELIDLQCCQKVVCNL